MVMEMLTIPNQIAYLYLSRPEDYNLEELYKLLKRRWPYHSEISAFAEKIHASRNC